MKIGSISLGSLLCLALLCGHYASVLAEPPDTKPSVITSASPEDKTIGCDINTPISITFSAELEPSTLNTGTFHLYRIDNAEEIIVPGNVTYDADSRTASFIPSSDLSYATNYRLVIEGNVKDDSGNALESDYTWRFTTKNSVGGCGGS